MGLVRKQSTINLLYLYIGLFFGALTVVVLYPNIFNQNPENLGLLQIIVAKIIIDQGYVITNYYGLFGFYEIPWFLAQLSTLFVFLVIINSINFIDGVDGLAISEIIKTILLILFGLIGKS